MIITSRIYAAVYIATLVLIIVSIGIFIVRGKRSRVTYSFCICQLLSVIWIISQLLLMQAANDEQVFAYYCIGNCAICSIGTVWLIFAINYSHTVIKTGLAAVPVLISMLHYAAMLTTKSSGLFYTVFEPSYKITYGPLFYSNTIYTYLCIITGTALIIKKSFTDKMYSRAQGVLIALAVLMPFLINILTLFGIINVQNDITPLTFGFSSVVIIFSMYGYGFLDVNMVAGSKIIDSISDGIVIADKNGCITFENRIARQYIKYDRKNGINDFFDEFGLSGLTGFDGYEKECTVHTPDKVLNVKRYNFYTIKNKPAAFSIVISDVTRYYQLIKAGNETAAANTLLALEKERNTIAQQVHDTAGHTLTKINTMARMMNIEFGENKYSRRIESLATEGIAELRTAINNMKNDNRFNCVTHALEKLVSDIEGIEIDLCIKGDDGEKYMICANIFYECCREAITNTLRYSGADRIDIIARLNEDNAELYIFDNGKGCAELEKGHGLNGIIERADAVGGTVKIMTAENDGFGIRIILPLEVDYD